MPDLAPRPDEDLIKRHHQLFPSARFGASLWRPMFELVNDGAMGARWPEPFPGHDLDEEDEDDD